MTERPEGARAQAEAAVIVGASKALVRRYLFLTFDVRVRAITYR